MMPTVVNEQAPIPPPSSHRREAQGQARQARALHINAFPLNRELAPARVVSAGRPSDVSAVSATVTQRRRWSPPHLSRRVVAADRFAQNAVATLPIWDVHDWLASWPELALACGLPLGTDGKPCIPSPSQLCKRCKPPEHRPLRPFSSSRFGVRCSAI